VAAPKRDDQQVRTYTLEQKAEAIAAVALGESVKGVARRLAIPRTSLVNWLRATPPPAMKSGEVSRVSRVSSVDIGLVTDESRARAEAEAARVELGRLLYAYLAAGLRGLAASADLLEDREYLKSYSPGEAASLHRAVADRVVLVFRGIEGDEQPEAGPQSE